MKAGKKENLLNNEPTKMRFFSLVNPRKKVFGCIDAKTLQKEKVGQLVLGLASCLEAFSREPPCDSIGALAARQTPKTSGMAWEFLSYYPILPSRCLRDPLSYLGLF